MSALVLVVKRSSNAMLLSVFDVCTGCATGCHCVESQKSPFYPGRSQRRQREQHPPDYRGHQPTLHHTCIYDMYINRYMMIYIYIYRKYIYINIWKERNIYIYSPVGEVTSLKCGSCLSPFRFIQRAACGLVILTTLAFPDRMWMRPAIGFWKLPPN